MNLNKYIFLGLLILYLSSCTRTPSSPDVDPIPVIGVLLNTNTVYQFAELSEFTENSGILYDNQIDDAMIKVNDNILEYGEFNYGRWATCYHIDTMIIEPGKTYNLFIETENDEIINGTTTVPDSFEIYFDGDVVSWDKSKNTKYWSISIFSSNENIEIDDKIMFNSEIDIDESKLKDGDILTIYISAFDDNYYQYYQMNKHKCGIDNCYGVFASVCEIKKEFEINK